MLDKFEPIPVELDKVLDFLEKSISDPQLRWDELRDLLARQKAAQQSVNRTANRLCTDAVHIGPFLGTPEGNTKCDACGEEW